MNDLAVNLAETDLQIEGDDSGEEATLAVAPGRRRLVSQPSDPEVDSLYNRWKRGKLILQPEFQRQFVWDRTKASRLVESVLLALPLPIVYLAQERDGKELVIDGQQRLTSLFSFIDGKFPDGRAFRLGGLSVFKELEGKLFSQLEETQQDATRQFAMRVVTILKESDPSVKFETFRRLNTGAVPLNDMELRNCIYLGNYLRLLRNLAEDPDFKQLVGFKEPDRRMRDVELVLRFAAFYHTSYLHYQSPMKAFLNQDMEDHREISQNEADRLRKAFKNALLLVRSLFGNAAFRRYIKGTDANPNGAWEEKRFNAALYDVLMGVFCIQDKNRVYNALDSLREGIIDLMVSDQEFMDAILLGTSEPRRVTKRFDLLRMRVDSILAEHPAQPRCFSSELKRQLFEANPTCALCGNQIQHVDDAAVDHIEQYWRGGKTIPENARLAHRYCNWARPRND